MPTQTRDQVIAEIDEMIRLRATRSPAITQMQSWKQFILDATAIPEHLPLDAYEAAVKAYEEAERAFDADGPAPLDAGIRAYLGALNAPAVVLQPCPFCKQPLKMRSGFNPIAKCETPKCFFAARQIGIPTDDPEQVRAWNDRAEEVF